MDILCLLLCGTQEFPTFPWAPKSTESFEWGHFCAQKAFGLQGLLCQTQGFKHLYHCWGVLVTNKYMRWVWLLLGRSWQLSALLSAAGSGCHGTKSFPWAWMTPWTSWRWWRDAKPASASRCRWPTTEPWSTWAECRGTTPSSPLPPTCEGLLGPAAPAALQLPALHSAAPAAAVSAPRSTLKCAKKSPLSSFFLNVSYWRAGRRWNVVCRE